MRPQPVLLAAALCACEAAPTPAAVPAAPREAPQGVEMLRVDPQTRARWHALYAPGLEGTRVTPAAPPTTVIPEDERRLRAAVHAQAPTLAVPLTQGVAR